MKLPGSGANVNLTLDELPGFILISPVISFISQLSYFLFCYSSVALLSARPASHRTHRHRQKFSVNVKL